MKDDTIVAVATPPGRGGVGIVRVSGSHASIIAMQLSGDVALEPRTAYYRKFHDEQRALIDQGLLLYFKAPHSFTGEDVVEFQVHGSPIVMDEIVQACVRLGARCARPGEFSERAFLNDKIDLTQAEAIADLIQAHSITAARMAMNSLQGEFSKKINALSEAIIRLRLFVEAAIDFPEEEIDFLNDGKVQIKLNELLSTLGHIQTEAHQGTIMREGLSIVIAGRPNAGKSTLINALSGRDLVIVTDVPGTTRDVMRAHILLDDIPVHIIDTAGLRESDDVIEQEGIKRAWAELSRADCVLLVIDIQDSETVLSLDESVQSVLPAHVPMIRIFNKIDVMHQSPKCTDTGIYLSAKEGHGLAFLKDKIKQAVGFQAAEGRFIARRRHMEALHQANAHLTAGLHQLTQHRAGELLAEDLRLAHLALCDITGEFTADDLLGEIFSSFCIGK
jgi:tRNA modification GTPase